LLFTFLSQVPYIFYFRLLSHYYGYHFSFFKDYGIDGNENIAGLALSSFAIPLASSMTMGFAIGFMKG